MLRSFILASVAVASVSVAEMPVATAESQDSPTMKAVAMECMPGMKLTGEKDVLKQPPAHEQYYGDDGYGDGGGGPSSVVTTGSSYSYRYRFSYSYGNTVRYGWRYPLTYWNAYGRNMYGDGCSFDRAVGDYYYC